MSRVAIYARVSTDDRGQDPENQLTQLRAWCQSTGHIVSREYVDSVSGAKGAAVRSFATDPAAKSSTERHELGLLLDDAHRRKFDLVLCWSLDRLSREGLEPTIGYLRRLSAAGVAFHSYQEPMLSTDNPLVRDVLLAVMASMAAMERARISERTKAGLDRVRAKGQRLGRPELGEDMRARIADLAATGASAYRISKTLGCDIKTAAKYALLV